MLHDIVYYQISTAAYHWILALHIIAVICWFSGLCYLPRIFVYHAMTKDSATSATFKIMEYKLNYYIMHPAMAVTLFTGILLTHFYFLQHGLIPSWLLIKLGLIILLLIYQFTCGYHLRRFKQDRNTYSHRYFRYFNELSTLLLILIVIMVVIKPFAGGWSGVS